MKSRWVCIGITLLGVALRIHGSPSPNAATAAPSASATATETRPDESGQKAVSVDDVLTTAESKLTYQSTSDELKKVRTDVLSIPRTSSRYREAQQLLGRIDKYLAIAVKAEKRAASAWEYSEKKDQMGRGVTKFATVKSENELNFSFPYSDGAKATIALRQSPKYGKDVIIMVERGNFDCSYGGCKLSVRFDDGPIQAFTAGHSTDYSSTYLFITPYDRFISELRKANVVRIEADFFQQGSQVMEFKVAGLDW